MRVVVVAAKPGARSDLANLLDGLPDVEVVGVADMDEAQEAVDDLAPDAVFVDVRSTRQGERELVGMIAGQRPELPVEALTARESEVLQLLAAGFSNRQVAHALEVSEHTAKFHVASILGKLDARTRAEAVARAYRLGWVLA